MPKTAEKLREFQSAGGHLYYVDYPDVVALYALVYTWDSVRGGDLSYVSGEYGERQEIELATFLGFVREEFETDFLNRLERRFLAAKPAAKRKGGTARALRKSILDFY